MTGTKAKPEEIARLILEADTVAVCSHISPDGDTLGCAAAMRLALLKLGNGLVMWLIGISAGFGLAAYHYTAAVLEYDDKEL